MADYTTAVNKGRDFWSRIATNNGWTLKSLTVWVDEDGNMVDAVGIADGDSVAYIVDYETEKLLQEVAL